MEGIIRSVTEFLVPRLSPVILVLFGSEAAGRARPESDIDVAFLSDLTFDPYETFLIAQDLATLLGRDVDLVDLSLASDVLRMQILGKGRVILDPVGRARDYKVRAMKEYALLNEERKEVVDRYKERFVTHD